MQRPIRLMVISIIVPLMVGFAAPPAGAQYSIPQSVISNGGGQAGDGNLTLLSTVGQAAIGITSGPDYVHEIGFWYAPGAGLSAVVAAGDLLPEHFSLSSGFPNPGGLVTTLHFAVPRRSHVALMLYDATGREVRALVDGQFDPGFHRAVLNGAGLPGGIYFCRMVADSFSRTRRLVLVK